MLTELAMYESKGARGESGTRLSITMAFYVGKHYNSTELNSLFETHNKSQVTVHSRRNPASFRWIPAGLPQLLFPSPWEPC